MNFKNYGNQPVAAAVGGGGGKPPGSDHLARQGSIYSLTFDEFQNTMGKDFGSMNMDELLKSIWNAEELQTTLNNTINGVPEHGGSGGGGGGTCIRRQGSLTLPRTLSQKTVDEVWKDMSKEFNNFGQVKLPQSQQTLGEMTLEDFLVKAGVVREEGGLATNMNDNGLFSDLTSSQNTLDFSDVGFHQPARTTAVVNVDNNNQIAIQSSNLPLNVNGIRSGGGLQGGMGAGVPGGVVVPLGSPVVSSDGMRKNNGETSSVSPSGYEFSGIVRGRRSTTVEKGVERRQRRMIKNRESAARSRARKQAYTMELEAEVAKLKEQNQELKRKAETMERQQNQVFEMMNTQPGAKRRNLKRTLSGPW